MPALLCWELITPAAERRFPSPEGEGKPAFLHSFVASRRRVASMRRERFDFDFILFGGILRREISLPPSCQQGLDFSWSAQLFAPLALNVKICLLPFNGGEVFEG
ncbi:MAG TPA: hypothetical protein VNM92_05815 [Thermoanaerobaculia bacterium]|nr:hypothetical protein [Thermoanaerobaculia bacterium]